MNKDSNSRKIGLIFLHVTDIFISIYRSFKNVLTPILINRILPEEFPLWFMFQF
jgi:hypothetical protein